MNRFLMFTCWLLLVSIAFIMTTTGCNKNIAGATTETTNGVAGVICNSENSPMPNIVVKLFPDDYNPVADGALDGCFIDTTDIHGTYSFKKLKSGVYVVLARDLVTSTTFSKRDITVSDSSLITVPSGTLKGPGSIEVDFSSIGNVSAGYLYIPGTDIYSNIGNNGSALLSDVPCGTIQRVFYITGDEKFNIVRSEITVETGKTAVINLPLWKYSRQIILNTTPSGAGVPVDIYNFPVLIRLNGSNFDFSQAGAGGCDIVFTDKNNLVLPHEIERWDTAAEHAEIWVKADTIHGNDSTQAISMYWGNQAVTKQLSNGAVFDTSDGYQGVWHMGKTVLDATVNRYDGSSPDSASPQVAEGIIGNCRVFDGNRDFITMPNTANGKLNFPEGGNYTISAWVSLDTLDSASHCIVSKGYEQYYLRSTYISASIPTLAPLWEFVEFSETAKWQASNCPATIRQWMLITGVRQGSRQLIYCNGELADSTFDAWPNTVSRNTSNDLFIGRFSKAVTVPINEGFCFFKGSIDEVRIISLAQTSSRVRLCYMNQRPDDRLVVFR
jgi:hypothetical protein